MEYAIKAPQLSEAVQTVTIVKYLRNEGDVVRQDEPIMILETDKAAMDVESPVNGTIHKIHYSAGSVVAVGETLLVMMVDDSHGVQKENHKSKAFFQMDYMPVENITQLQNIIKSTRNGALSPRNKAYCLGNKVIPLNLYRNGDLSGLQAKEPSPPNNYYTDLPLAKSQLRLIQVFAESAQHVIQANIQTLCDNTPIENYRKTTRQKGKAELLPSRLEIISWAIVCALKKHPVFCSRILNSTTIRRFRNPSIGIAVALENDELTTAVVQNAFSYNLEELIKQVRVSIEAARDKNYHVPYHSIVISDLSSIGVINAIPVVTQPAVATLFVGRPYLKEEKEHLFNFSLSFDHRLVNGAGAAGFLRDVTKSIKYLQAA